MARRRKRPVFRRYFYGRFGYKLWPFLILIGLMYYAGFDPSSSEDYDSLNQTSDLILTKILPLIVGTFAVFLVYFVISTIRARRINSEKSANREFSFKDRPWEYNRMFIELTGRVEYVFKNDPSFVFRRKMTDIYRTITKDENHAGRHVHERFLLSSPQLAPNEKVMIINNTRFDRERVKAGDWISVKGEYLHDLRHDNRKSKNFYGKLHYTHEPKGYVIKVKLVKEEMKALANKKVVVSMPMKPQEFLKDNK